MTLRPLQSQTSYYTVRLKYMTCSYQFRLVSSSWLKAQLVVWDRVSNFGFYPYRLCYFWKDPYSLCASIFSFPKWEEQYKPPRDPVTMIFGNPYKVLITVPGTWQAYSEIPTLVSQFELLLLLSGSKHWLNLCNLLRPWCYVVIKWGKLGV